MWLQLRFISAQPTKTRVKKVLTQNLIPTTIDIRYYPLQVR